MIASLEINDVYQIGREMYDLIVKMYPICRSITGNGVRETLQILQSYLPLQVVEVPTGTPVFDWIVPKEWNIYDAYVKNAKGEKIIDFQKSNLHILNYSIPVHQKMSLCELSKHLFSMPDHPTWIPYRTSYYHETWGFCLPHNMLQSLEEDEYEVHIDASLEDGYLTYGEYFIPGETADEILFSCHICHPSLCNDNLSGIALAIFLAKQLQVLPRRYSYRFLFIPGTIGSITWLSLNEAKVDQIKHGLVISGVGDSGHLTYKKSRRGDAEIDRAVTHILKQSEQEYSIEDFTPYGYDERQYCSPGFNLPVGRLGRTPFGQYPEYHTSADDLNFIHPAFLTDSFNRYSEVVDVLESNRTYLNTNSKCEPQLGRRGFYGTLGGQQRTPSDRMAMLWVLNLSDGDHDLLSIAERSGLSFSMIKHAAAALAEGGLLKEC
jgi:aminopeptidase-like protein